MMPNVSPTLTAGTIELTPITLAAISASGNGVDQTNQNSRGITVGINVTAVTGSIVVTIQGKDPASGTYYTLLASAAIAAPAFSTLTLYPGDAVTTNISANGNLPSQFRIAYTIVTGPVTCTISPVMLP